LKTERTIAEAARLALQHIGKPSRIREIYQKILELGLYEFNTPTPEHVLRTEIRRKTAGIERVDLSAEIHFRMPSEEIYELMKEPTKRRGAVGMKRIQRASDKESIIELLTSDSVGAFREIWRLLFFAAMVGFKNRRREPLTSTQSGEGIRQDSFANNPVWLGTLYLLGLVETGTTDVLRGTEEAEDERIKVFEEYANGGLAILKEEFEASNYSLDALLTFIQSQTGATGTKTPDLQVSI
jgi:dnd system-associated protein 4